LNPNRPARRFIFHQNGGEGGSVKTQLS